MKLRPILCIKQSGVQGFIPGGEEWKTDGIERPLTAAYEELTAK